MTRKIKCNKKDITCFKVPSMNLELLDIGNEKMEIRPIHKPKRTKFEKVPRF